MWDQRYSEEGFAYGAAPNDFIKEQFAHIPTGGRVLCLAEGEGRNAVFLAKQGYQVTAVDQSSVGLEKAQRLADENGVTITTVVADLAGYDLDSNVWDGIVSISAHVPAELRKSVHQRAVSSLKKDGVFILEAYTPRHHEIGGVGGPPASQPAMMMTLSGLKQELSGLEFIIGVELDRYISEGKYHNGESAVVQVVAKKNG